ncbi:nicotinate (nicotinamide) nucleotide adenylyltransferase [Nodularia sphaerocarpa]|uniref:nicotinate (nicotinamide) nucleotide adenylyltransferase n=1 Tax=Nodularia sphaerocarpa TaxID=137816 RepID=UPI001EFB575E|nr:nicotinate (nicotinamide) nucleotide adenylyltransferase [Nodularia sphaerocarpa]MDB9373381.1 nicotinate (nicotinamide) nucleotide adenylyltransferase [Nodularia sphaerocarpa CS-585]MDB9380186.1 nicotinate (nicotinamide) nucleotide adenylyltransferase [Nodularia sphaerocarpa CS-585A2]ULP71373.1 Nicotinate-nucleotide adenylyltransferase [Nodularia sphaerocarpa UHCC 0038]
MQQIGIFGGTFDPIHWGHLLVAQTALNQVPLEKVIWVPSLNPPHKKAVLFEHRWEMLKLATRDHPRFTVSLVETKRSGTSYAINTLMDLSSCYANTHWYSIVGLDTFKTLPRWYRGHEVAHMCDWLIAPRLLGGETIAQSELICKQVEQQLTERSLTIRWQLLNIPLVGISSSLVRKLCRDRQSIRYLVPESVRHYITTHSLYSGKSE